MIHLKNKDDLLNHISFRSSGKLIAPGFGYCGACGSTGCSEGTSTNLSSKYRWELLDESDEGITIRIESVSMDRTGLLSRFLLVWSLLVSLVII